MTRREETCIEKKAENIIYEIWDKLHVANIYLKFL